MFSSMPLLGADSRRRYSSLTVIRNAPRELPLKNYLKNFHSGSSMISLFPSK